MSPQQQVSQQQGDLRSYILEGERRCKMTVVDDFHLQLSQAAPEVLERISRLVSEFPENWPSGLHGGEEGQAKAKRAVSVDLPSTLSFQTPDGRTHTSRTVLVTGVLFSKSNLENQVAHTGHRAGFLDPEDFVSGNFPWLDQLPEEMRKEVRSLYKEALKEVYGSEEEMRQELQRMTKTVEFDRDGRPLISHSTGSLRGGHGFETAKRKFELARELLPRYGLRGPLVFGYGEFLGDDFRMEGKKLGVYLSLTRTDEPERFGDYLVSEVDRGEKKYLAGYQSRISDLSMKVRGGELFGGGSVGEKLSAGEEFAKIRSELHKIGKNPVAMLKPWFPIDLYRQGFNAYGRALRRILGDDLSRFEKMLVPFRFPHTGNLAIDFSSPSEDGGFQETWYDLGGWKLGSEMTREQAFAYAYYTFEYGLRSTMDQLQTASNPLAILSKAGEIDLVKDYLAGFFFDRQDDPDFRRWEVRAVSIVGNDEFDATSTNVALTFKQHVLQPDLPAPYERIKMPYVKLMRKMMGFDPDESESLIDSKEIGKICERVLPRKTMHHRSFAKVKANLYQRIAELANREVLTKESVSKIFLTSRLHDSSGVIEVAQAVNSAVKTVLLDGRENLSDVEVVLDEAHLKNVRRLEGRPTRIDSLMRTFIPKFASHFGEDISVEEVMASIGGSEGRS